MLNGKDQSITLSGSWQKLSLPKRFLALYFQNSNTHSVDVAKNMTTGAYLTLAAGEGFSYPIVPMHSPYQDEIYVKGTASDVIK